MEDCVRAVRGEFHLLIHKCRPSGSCFESVFWAFFLIFLISRKMSSSKLDFLFVWHYSHAFLLFLSSLSLLFSVSPSLFLYLFSLSYQGLANLTNIFSIRFMEHLAAYFWIVVFSFFAMFLRFIHDFVVFNLEYKSEKLFHMHVFIIT